MSKEEKECVIPSVIVDVNSGRSYIKGRFFGKGGFAKCYEIKESKTHRVFAGKIVPKSQITKSNHREKMTQEISIHRNLKHQNVVGFYSFFDDPLNVYIILELCRKRSMMELHKRRKALTECETRYYMKQILDGVHYLHQNKIIHRDLKLGNLFLSDDLQVKIGDFGLATRLEHDGERKKTVCGTPNYIAPEILTKSGHSYEVDVWSIGCIMYTLLVGKPPFETSSLRETYARIKQVQYIIPEHINTIAMNMISNMLQGNPSKRPTVGKLIKDRFFTCGYMPQSLPLSCLTMAPRLDMLEMHNQRKPLTEMNTNVEAEGPNFVFRVPNSPARKVKPADGASEMQKMNPDIKTMLQTLREQLSAVLKAKPNREMAESEGTLIQGLSIIISFCMDIILSSDGNYFLTQNIQDRIRFLQKSPGMNFIPLSASYLLKYVFSTSSVLQSVIRAVCTHTGAGSDDDYYVIKWSLLHTRRSNSDFVDEMTDPAAQPVVWISKWVDYSDKYGFGYQLSDDGVGVMYNDGTRLIMLANCFNIHYINREGNELYYTVREYPPELEKKMKLLNFFLKYMKEYLMKAGSSFAVKPSDAMSRIPYIHQWFRTQSAVVMQLTNGTVQINFLDHTKIIMCPLMAAVTYIDEDKNFKTYKFQTIQENGCCKGLAKNLAYAHEKLMLMLSNPQVR